MKGSLDYSVYYLDINDENNLEGIIEYTQKLIQNVLHEDKNARILDIGCGQGYLLMALKRLGYNNVVGIDIDKGQIEGCKRHGVPGILVENTELYLSEHINEFDLIFICDVLEHIPKENTVDVVICIYHSLKSGGKLFCKVPNANSVVASRYRYIDWTHCTSFTEYSLKFVLKSGGFSSIQIADEPYIVLKDHRLKGIVFLILRKIYRFFLRIVLNLEIGAEGRRIPLNPNIIGIAQKE